MKRFASTDVELVTWPAETCSLILHFLPGLGMQLTLFAFNLDFRMSMSLVVCVFLVGILFHRCGMGDKFTIFDY